MKNLKNKILSFCSHHDTSVFQLVVLIIVGIATLSLLVSYLFNSFSFLAICNSLMIIMFLSTIILYKFKPNKNLQDTMNQMILIGILYLFVLEISQ